MKKMEKQSNIKELLKDNYMPMIFEKIDSNIFENSYSIPSQISKDDLVGHYEGLSYVAPNWYQELINKKYNFLIIEGLDEISEKEQEKFIELIEYRKISTFILPKNVRIILLCKNIEKISEKIKFYSAVI